MNTPTVFGEYINVYDINRGIEDGEIAPIYYESRLARIEPDEDERPWASRKSSNANGPAGLTQDERYNLLALGIARKSV